MTPGKTIYHGTRPEGHDARVLRMEQLALVEALCEVGTPLTARERRIALAVMRLSMAMVFELEDMAEGLARRLSAG